MPTKSEKEASSKGEPLPVTRGHSLQDAVEIEELDYDLFKSKVLWIPTGARGVFGGQIAAQSIAASNATVKKEFALHSLHSYFLLAGKTDVPVYYHVTRIRDGGSYVTRFVKAVQKGRTIYTIMLSYQIPEASQPRFSIPSPALRGPEWTSQLTQHLKSRITSPENSPSKEERHAKVLKEKGHLLDEAAKERLNLRIKGRNMSTLEMRDALPGSYDDFGIPKQGYEAALWIKSRYPFPGDGEANKVALAFSSDFDLIDTIAKALNVNGRISMMASLDHSIWFYNDFDINDWLLYVMQTQAAGSGRGVCIGRIYRRDGTLIAVVSQEGLVRAKLPVSSVL